MAEGPQVARGTQQGQIPGNRVLEEVGKLHVQLSHAESQIEALVQNNNALANQLKVALTEAAEYKNVIAQLQEKLASYETASKEPTPVPESQGPAQN